MAEPETPSVETEVTTTDTTETTEQSVESPELQKWKQEARKHEKRAKQQKERADEQESRLRDLETASKPADEKEIEAARVEARKEALAEAEAERRNDRLEVAVAKHARELADVDDVLLNVRHALATGSVDEDDIFEDGRVNSEGLKTTLDQLLEQKPHLKAAGPRLPQGDADSGRGEGGSAKDPADAHNELVLGLLGRT